MSNQSPTNAVPSEPNAGRMLMRIIRRYPGRLSLTGGLVVAENALELLYPLAAGIAIDAVISGDLAMALAMVAVIFGLWVIGAVREAVDSRVYAGIYANLAGDVIDAERRGGIAATTTIVHTNLTRQFVDFFEVQVPVFATALVSILGSVIMLLILNTKIGLVALALMVLSAVLARRYMRISECIAEYLHDRQETEPQTVTSGSKTRVERHFRVLAGRRVQLSDMEASAYLFVGFVAASLFGALFWMLTGQDGVTGGTLYVLMSYIWTFALNLDRMPEHLQALGKVRDLGRRIDTGT